MVTVLRSVLVGVLVGGVLGALARAMMRLVAIGAGDEPEFHLGVSLAILSLFAVSALGTCLARAYDLSGWALALVVLLSSGPLFMMASAFGVGETAEISDHDLAGPWKAELLAMAAVIIGMTLVTPYAGWRAGRLARRR